MWTYYTAVVVVGIGFITIGMGWTLLGLSIGLGGFFGWRYRAPIKVRLGQAWECLPDKIRLNAVWHKAPKPKSRPIEEADRHWMFEAAKLPDVRREGFDALSESFLLLKRMAPYFSAALFEYDTDTHLAYPRIYSAGSESFRRDAILSVSDGVVGYCLSSGKVVHYADFKGDARLLGYYSAVEEIRSVIVFPLDRTDRRLGALVLDSKVPDAFAPRMDEIQHLATLFTELLSRVQREETFLVKLEEDRTLKAMTERMAKAGVSIEEVAESLCHLAKDVFPADRVTYVVFDASPERPSALEPIKTEHPSIVRFRSLKMLDRYVELVERTRKTIRLDDLWENSLMSLATGQTGLTTRSILAAPFVFEDRVIGVLLLEADRKRAFNTFHETAIGELVSHTSAAVARSIDYSRMEKTCAIADLVPAAADRIFTEPSLEPLVDLLKSRFGVMTQIYEVIAPKNGEIRIRPWEQPEAEEKELSQFQKNALENGTSLARAEGKVTPADGVRGELPAGADLVFPLSSGSHAQWPFGLFCVTLRTPLRAESIQILDRIRCLIQIRLILERRERQFGFLKIRDPLTGVFHTATFDKKLEECARNAKHSGTSFHLLLIEPGRLSALKRTHGFAEYVRRYTSLCAQVERICGPRATVGRIGVEDVGVIWAEAPDQLKHVKQQLERLSDSLGFQVRVGSAEFTAETDGSWALIEAAARALAHRETVPA